MAVSLVELCFILQVVKSNSSNIGVKKIKSKHVNNEFSPTYWLAFCKYPSDSCFYSLLTTFGRKCSFNLAAYVMSRMWSEILLAQKFYIFPLKSHILHYNTKHCAAEPSQKCIDSWMLHTTRGPQ